MTTYRIMIDGEPVCDFSGDFAQASSPVLLDGDSTPFQVADFRHRPNADCAERLLLWSHNQGASMCSVSRDDDDQQVVDGEITVESVDE